MTHPEKARTIHAEYVGDNANPTTSLTTSLWTPERMGRPKEGQLEGTKLERLAELAGRVCYDSLGKGRSSAEYHKHILQVGHLSVLEHGNFTVELTGWEGEDLKDAVCSRDVMALLPFLVNRPGVWLRVQTHSIRASVNLRAVLEWETWTQPSHRWHPCHKRISALLRQCARVAAPQIVSDLPLAPADPSPRYLPYSLHVVTPTHDEEQWITLFLCGSRGMSHEQVRHGDRTAISQRSTRYVDESKTEWVIHPLIEAYGLEVTHDDWTPDLGWFEATESGQHHSVEDEAQGVYTRAVDALQSWLVAKGVDKLTARKQARGAARGYLGNALYTEMIFSASVAQWKRMIRMRCSPAADAEIRALYAQVIPALRESTYHDEFAAFTLRPSPDGIGVVIEES